MCPPLSLSPRAVPGPALGAKMHLLLLKAPANSNQRRPRQAAQRATPRSPSPPACPHPSFLPGWKIWPQTALVTGKSRVSSSKQNRGCELSSFRGSSEGMAWEGWDPALAGPARKVGVCFGRQEGCQEQGELCQGEGGERLGGWGAMEGKCMLVKWSLS